MERVCRGFFFLLLLMALPTTLGAVDYLFVFHAGTTASVYDAASLELLGSPEVGPGAVQALGARDPSNPGSFLKIYVVKTDSITILDPEPPFAVRSNFSLVSSINRGEESALLTPDERRVMLMVGEDIQFFEVDDAAPRLTTTVEMGAEVVDATVLPSAERAFVATENSRFARSILLTSDPPQRLAGPLELPEVPMAIRTALNGSAVYAGSDGELFEINPGANTLTATITTGAGSPVGIGFDPEAPVSTSFITVDSSLFLVDLPSRERQDTIVLEDAIRKAVSPGQDRIFVLGEETGRIFRVVPSSGSVTELNDPRTGSPFVLPAVDAEVDAAAKDLYFAFGSSGLIAKLTANGAFFRGSVFPPFPPTGIALISTPGETPSTLEIYGGDNQIAATTGPLPKPLAVRVLDGDMRPVFGVTVSFETDETNVVFGSPSATTNRDGLAQTTVSAPVTTPFEVTAELDSNGSKVVFTVNQGAAGEEGLNKISGDYQIALSGSPFPLPLGVRALADGAVVPDLTLTSDDLSTGTVCDASKMTDEDGEATFACTAPTVPVTFSIQAQIIDEFGRTLREPFEATAVPTTDDLPQTLRLFSSRRLMGIAGETLPDAIRLDTINTSGALVERAGIQFTSDDDVTVTPSLAIVRPGGALADVTLGCKLGDGTIKATLNAPGLFEEEIFFETVPGPPASLVKTQGDLQTGGPGELLDAANQQLIAEVRDMCGNRLAEEPVVWEINPPDAATIVSTRNRSTGLGRVFATIQLGEQPGPLTVTALVGALSATFELFVSTPASQLSLLSGDGQLIPVGEPAPLPLVVQLLDEAGEPAPRSDVEFAVIQGAATPTETRVSTDAQGQASVGLIAGDLVGAVVVEVRSGGLRAVFNLTIIGRLPMVTEIGFVNAGSFVPGWVPGSAGSIFGTGLSQISGVSNPGVFPFPTEFRGVRVLVNGVPAPIFAIANVGGVEQINIQVPFEIPAPADDVEVTIENNGASATFSGIETLRVQPGMFELTVGGGRFAAALHLDFSLVEPSNPARPGETILLFLTGMGPIDPPVATNTAGPEPAAVTVEEPTVVVGGTSADVLGSFYAPGLVTLYQINFVIPGLAPSGDLVITVRAAGVGSQEALIPVER